MVVSARLGNYFITSLSTDQRPCVCLYLVDDCHSHGISSICIFSSAKYFCLSCLKHYINKERHECEVTCIVCKTTDCPITEETVTCQKCHMMCRSKKCYQRYSAKNKGHVTKSSIRPRERKKAIIAEKTFVCPAINTS